MVSSLFYRRPSYVNRSHDSLTGEEKQNSINDSIQSCSSFCSHGIPEALSFDRIVTQGTCPPVTVRDFMNYLKYVEYSAENLQFFLWFRDYSARWEKLSDSDKALSPAWARTHPERDFFRASLCPQAKVTPPATAAKDIDAAENSPKVTFERFDPGDISFYSTLFDDAHDSNSEYNSSMSDEKTLRNSTAHRSVTEQAFDDAVTTQPFRDELSRIVRIYIAHDSPRELNLSARERQTVLHALQNTTHPSAFKSVITAVEYSLRKQSHPNFIRWAICNGNRPRVVFARGLGIAGILIGFVADLLLTLSHVSRVWRVLPFVGWFIGTATLIAAWKGMCVVLHDTLVSGLGNSYEDEPWVPKYKKRNLIRKIFDREIWIQEPALRQIQDTIFWQALLGAFLVSCVFVGIFCAVPRGNFY